MGREAQCTNKKCAQFPDGLFFIFCVFFKPLVRIHVHQHMQINCRLLTNNRLVFNLLLYSVAHFIFPIMPWYELKSCANFTIIFIDITLSPFPNHGSYSHRLRSVLDFFTREKKHISFVKMTMASIFLFEWHLHFIDWFHSLHSILNDVFVPRRREATAASVAATITYGFNIPQSTG